MSSPFLSVVIPARNEESGIVAALQRLSGWADTEIIVAADDACRDATAERAATVPGVRVLHGAGKGRGAALDAGARQACGRYLLLLHADSRLEEASVRAAAALLDGTTIAAAFRMRLDSPRLVYRLIERGVNFRSGLLGLPYGDQGLLLSRRVFELVGGVRPLSRCEDLDLVLRLKRLGRVRLADGVCTTSTRRWDRDGVFKVTFSNLLTLFRFLTTGAVPHAETQPEPRIDPDPRGASADSPGVG